MRCRFCENLSISQLIELAEVEFKAHYFPQKAYHQHHASYNELLESANRGCDLCLLILEGFQETILDSLAMDWEGYTIAAALQDIESRGHATDLKLCINAGHLYDGQMLKDTKLLDTLMIQAGNILIPEDEDHDENWIPPLELMISAPRTAKIRDYAIGRRQVDLDLGSDSNFDIARTWLRECSRNHASCSRIRPSNLPTRVIDVESKDPRILISHEIEAEYVALSHCWDGSISPVLTTDNLAEFQNSISLADLPANFRDAIKITRRLQIPYLWIDSLCIIQNSRDDWEAESKKMCSIYRDACVMISADAASRSTDGILGHNLPGNPNRTTVALNLSDDINDGVISILKKQDCPQSFGELVLKSPLGRRGWTLQEGLLSRRVLHYGFNQIYWQCLQGLQSADGVPTGLELPEDERYPELAKLTHSADSLILQNYDLKNILEEYYRIVTAYTQRHLSFESDKLPAFAGIAESFHSVFKEDYLAGIWVSDLHTGLLWYGENGSCRPVETYRAPSWSWAVTDEPVLFGTTKIEGFEDIFEADFLYCEMDIQGINRYGQIRSSTLVMEGLTKQLVRSSQLAALTSIDDDEWKYRLGNIDWDDGDYGGIYSIQGSEGSFLLSVKLITPSEERDMGIELQKEWQMKADLFYAQKYTLLLIKSTPHGEDGIDSSLRRGYGLVLAQLDGNPDKFTRVGYLTISITHKTDFERFMEGWESRTVAIV